MVLSGSTLSWYDSEAHATTPSGAAGKPLGQLALKDAKVERREAAGEFAGALLGCRGYDLGLYNSVTVQAKSMCLS